MNLAHFIKQKPYEHIVYVLRRHPITFIPTLVLFVILLAIPPLFYIAVQSLWPTLLQGDVTYPVLILIASGYYLFVYIFFFTNFIDYYLDIWIVTNDRIIDIEQFGLFSRTISELDLFRIQDVTTDVHGVLPTFFEYGDVTVKTASSNVGLIFRQVARPDTIRHELLRLSHEDRKYHYAQPTIEDHE